MLLVEPAEAVDEVLDALLLDQTAEEADVRTRTLPERRGPARTVRERRGHGPDPVDEAAENPRVLGVVETGR